MSSREVELTGGAPWGFRMHGGEDQNQPLRISRRYSDTAGFATDVNPGRKASLSGIREGDVISSIDGRATRGVSNAGAHAMLRAAGPVLRLGLNEDRDMSPRRRSIGKANDLKRPSQLLADSDRAMPQAPVYATIKPSPSPHHRPSPSTLRSSTSSLPALTSTPLVRSVQPEETIRIHPTNPFYTTLPSNTHSSPSKLPIPNGRPVYSTLDRPKTIRDAATTNFQNQGFKPPSQFTKSYNSESCINSHGIRPENYTNGIENHTKSDSFSYDNLYNEHLSNGLPNRRSSGDNYRDPFDTSRVKDPFEKYLRPETNHEFGNKMVSNSLSDNNFHTKEELTKSTSITERKISEIEEVKTTKKFILNGSDDGNAYRQPDHQDYKPKPIPTNGTRECDYMTNHKSDIKHSALLNNLMKNYNPTPSAPPQETTEYYKNSERKNGDRDYSYYRSPQDDRQVLSPLAETSSSNDVSNKPPVRSTSSPSAPAPANPSAKRKSPSLYYRDYK